MKSLEDGPGEFVTGGGPGMPGPYGACFARANAGLKAGMAG
jgi:hypothetical protein